MPPPITTKALGEEGTTTAIDGEELETTLALGEEEPTETTLALGEEDPAELTGGSAFGSF